MSDPREFGRVAVVMGGDSAEREVSLDGGRDVLAGLQRAGVEAFAVDGAPALLKAIEQQSAQRVFIMLHGRGGEDGTLQGALETLGVPYTGSGVLGSALCMDKMRCKQVWQACGLPTPAWRIFDAHQDAAASWQDDALEALGLPLFVKPVREGSSVGMTLVEDAAQLPDALQLAARYDHQVMVEQFVAGAEYTAGVLDGRSLPLIKIETSTAFYDYDAKYLRDDTRYLCPCGLPEERESEFAELAMQAFEAAGASGWGRVDFMVDEQQRPWLLDVNTVPGMTSHSLIPKAALAAGIEFEQLLVSILETSQAQRRSDGGDQR